MLNVRVYAFSPSGYPIPGGLPISDRTYSDEKFVPIPSKGDYIYHKSHKLEVSQVNYAYTASGVCVEILALYSKNDWKSMKS